MGDVIDFAAAKALREPRERVIEVEIANEETFVFPLTPGTEVHNMTSMDALPVLIVAEIVTENGDRFTIVDQQGYVHQIERDGAYWITVIGD